MKVFVLGGVSVFERDGVYQIYVKVMQEDGGKENFVGFLKSVEYNNPGREKRKSEKCAQHSNRADGKILPRGNVR